MKFEQANGCGYKECENYPSIKGKKLLISDKCRLCIHFKPFNLLKRDGRKTKNSKNKNKK